MERHINFKTTVALCIAVFLSIIALFDNFVWLVLVLC